MGRGRSDGSASSLTVGFTQVGLGVRRPPPRPERRKPLRVTPTTGSKFLIGTLLKLPPGEAGEVVMAEMFGAWDDSHTGEEDLWWALVQANFDPLPGTEEWSKADRDSWFRWARGEKTWAMGPGECSDGLRVFRRQIPYGGSATFVVNKLWQHGVLYVRGRDGSQKLLLRMNAGPHEWCHDEEVNIEGALESMVRRLRDPLQ